MFLNSLDVAIPRWGHIALSFVVGLGLATEVGLVCGLLGLFDRVFIIVGMLVLILFLSLLIKKNNSRRVPGSFGVADAYYYRKALKKTNLSAYYSTIIKPANIMHKVLGVIFSFGIGVIIFLYFYHGLFYPITYWDSLSYLGMARRLFLDGRFPIKVMAQMGIGTGSNYPQMYRVACAMPCAVAGFWSDYYAQMIAPFSGLVSALLVYHIVLRLSRTRLMALAIMLLFTCIPYSIRYFSFTSDYALAIVFTAGFLYTALLYLDTRLRGYFILSAIIAALACNINYLMPLLAVACVFLAIIAPPLQFDEQEEKTKSSFYMRLILFCAMLALPWYFRNIIVTGNPVYPYFSGIFGGKNINRDVMRSMEGEWLENGDGIDKATLAYIVDKKQKNELSQEKISSFFTSEKESAKFSLGAKLRATPYYFMTSPQWSWALAPMFQSLTIPGILALIGIILMWILKGIRDKKTGEIEKGLSAEHRFGILVLFVFFSFWGYHYFMAGYYLYQILPVLIPIAVLAFVMADKLRNSFSQTIFYLWCLFVFFMPGLPFALMNFKLAHDVVIEGSQEYPFELAALRRPGLPKEKFYYLVFGDDMYMFSCINRSLLGKTLLTHDNRYLLYDPTINIVHLDDWEIQKTYPMSDLDRLRHFSQMRIQYYLKIPMQEKHRILLNLGLDKWEELGYLILAQKNGGNVLYSINEQPLFKNSDGQTSPPEQAVIINKK